MNQENNNSNNSNNNNNNRSNNRKRSNYNRNKNRSQNRQQNNEKAGQQERGQRKNFRKRPQSRHKKNDGQESRPNENDRQQSSQTSSGPEKKNYSARRRNNRNSNQPGQQDRNQRRSHSDSRPRREENKDQTRHRGSSQNKRRRNQSQYQSPFKKNSRPPSSKFVVSTYLKLLDLHNKARKRFYEQFHRVNRHQLNKLVNYFTQSLKDLREFEVKLPEKQKTVLEGHTDYFPRDTQFSKAHPEAEIASEEEKGTEENKTLSDRHLKPEQVNRTSYQDDTEESSGTIEDYHKYKGTVPTQS